MLLMEAGSSELLFWGGVAIMAIVVVMAVVCIIIFGITGRKLKRKMEDEYGTLEP